MRAPRLSRGAAASAYKWVLSLYVLSLALRTSVGGP